MRAPVANLPIHFDDVSFAVHGVTILDRINFAFVPGAPSVVIGPNGAGKTTLLRLAMGLIQPTSGRATWGGRTDAPLSRRAIVFQRPVMLRRSVAANLRYALEAAGVSRADHDARLGELLALVGLAELGDRPARKLSGGEQQRLALARALAKDPQVLFLDEPTASLDPAATKAVEDLVRDVAARGIKVVMSTHDLGEARRLAGDVVLMHRGRIVEASDAAAFFNNPITDGARRFVAGELLI
ncbi:MAG: ATP-binding cassette domain-containing protein [Xanthobacteraceae bacterium]|nr:ATP-binding cassette domain-containing protein [Xanthobacteraceae bacterium]